MPYSDPEKKREHDRRYYTQNKGKVLANVRRWSGQNKDRVRVYKRRWRERNLAYKREYQRKRSAADVEFKLKKVLRTRLYCALKRGQKTGSAVDDLGCSIGQLKCWLEYQFQPEMTWDNYGEWHIDHVIPLSSFDLTDRQQLLEACNWYNLQPLWAVDNLNKGMKKGG